MNKYQFIDEIARQMERSAWAEYDAGNGKCTNESGWRLHESLEHAQVAVAYLRDNGFLSEKAMAILRDSGEEKA